MNRTLADDLADLYSDPEYWMKKAEALRASAWAIWYCRKATQGGEILRELGSELPVNMAGGTCQVYRMLCGMSLELAYKASLVALGKGVAKTHNLVWLAEQAGIGLSSKKRGLLALLSQYIIWEGRYPAPSSEFGLEFSAYLHYENLFQKMHTGNVTELEPIEPHPLGWDCYNELWESAVSAFDWWRS